MTLSGPFSSLQQSVQAWIEAAENKTYAGDDDKLFNLWHIIQDIEDLLSRTTAGQNLHQERIDVALAVAAICEKLRHREEVPRYPQAMLTRWLAHAMCLSESTDWPRINELLQHAKEIMIIVVRKSVRNGMKVETIKGAKDDLNSIQEVLDQVRYPNV